MVSQEGQRGSSLPDGADSTHQDVQAITVAAQSKLATQLAQPNHGGWRPSAPNGADELRRQQDQDKETAHAFQRLDPHIFHIQTFFLIEAIAMLDVAALAPVAVDLTDNPSIQQRDVGQQDQVMLALGVVGDQHPQGLLRFGQADFEPAEVEVDTAFSAGVGEDHVLLKLKRHTGDQVKQQLGFPVLQARVEDFDPAVVRGAKDELSPRLTLSGAGAPPARKSSGHPIPSRRQTAVFPEETRLGSFATPAQFHGFDSENPP